MDSDCQHLLDVEYRQKADVVVPVVPRAIAEHHHANHSVDGGCRGAGKAQLVGHSNHCSGGEPGRAGRAGVVGLALN